VQIQTTSLETRTGNKLRNPHSDSIDDDMIDNLNEYRQHFQEHRHFTKNSKRYIKIYNFIKILLKLIKLPSLV